MKACGKLVEYILSYESDTFTSKGFKVTKEEAEKVADLLIKDLMASLDGVDLDAYLYEVRHKLT